MVRFRTFAIRVGISMACLASARYGLDLLEPLVSPTPPPVQRPEPPSATPPIYELLRAEIYDPQPLGR